MIFSFRNKEKHPISHTELCRQNIKDDKYTNSFIFVVPFTNSVFSLRRHFFPPVSKLRRKIESPSSTSHRSTYSDSKCAKRNNLSNNETYNSNTIIKRFATIDIASTPKKRSRHSTCSKQLERTVQVFATPSVIFFWF